MKTFRKILHKIEAVAMVLFSKEFAVIAPDDHDPDKVEILYTDNMEIDQFEHPDGAKLTFSKN